MQIWAINLFRSSIIVKKWSKDHERLKIGSPPNFSPPLARGIRKPFIAPGMRSFMMTHEPIEITPVSPNLYFLYRLHLVAHHIITPKYVYLCWLKGISRYFKQLHLTSKTRGTQQARRGAKSGTVYRAVQWCSVLSIAPTVIPYKTLCQMEFPLPSLQIYR